MKLTSTDHKIFHEICRTMWDASDACMEIYKRDFQVDYKSDNSPVTEADLAVNDILIKALSRLTPKIPVISEELNPSWDERKDYQTYWLIDPIDGTKEFVAKTDQFTINLGLIQDGKPVLGWVLAPAYEEMIWGGTLTGHSRLLTIERDPMKAHLDVPKCNRWSEDRDKLVVACSRDHRKPEDNQFILKLSQDYYVKTLPIGSTLKIVKIACGEVHLYTRLSGINDWDLAAAHAVLLGAGGSVTTLDGKELVYNTKSQKLAPFICHSKLPFNPAIYAI